jgi:UDP-glucose:(heptosyl)LPS alpha-1,3-glucosyltransferase
MTNTEAGQTLQILQIVRSFGHGGGVEHVAYELQRAWQAAGIDTRVLTAAIEAPEERPAADLVVPWITRIASRGRGRYLGRMIVVPIFTLAATWRLKQVRGQRLVVSHGDSFAGDICVIHAVNRASVAEKRRLGNKLWMLNPMHLWVEFRDRMMIGGLRFRRYVAVSARVVEELKTLYGVPDARIAVIPNGVNIDRFRPEAGDRAGVRREFAIPPDAPLLLFAGHEFERKGLAHIIAAMPKLGTDVHLLVVGAGNPGPYRAMAEQAGIAPGRVVFTGGRSDLPRLYPAADAFVFPTYYESFALVCMEAMASGLPLFATRVGGIEDYLADGLNGYFIERDPDDIAARLRPVLADPALRERLGRHARATAETYAWPHIARQYVDLLHALKRERDAGRPNATRVATQPRVAAIS